MRKEMKRFSDGDLGKLLSEVKPTLKEGG